MAKVIVRKSVEIYNEEYHVGDIIPYLYWEDAAGNEHELFDARLDIIGDYLISVTPVLDLKNSTHDFCNISVECIEENKDMCRFEYRGISGSYYISRQGVVYAKTPQEAIEQLKDTQLSNVWSKNKSEWRGNISYIELFYNGLPCPVKNNVLVFPKAYETLNIKDTRFEDKAFLQKIVDVISQNTDIKNEYAGTYNDSLTWDFDFGTSYMTNCGGNGLHFAYADDKGYERWSLTTANVDKFVNDVSCILKEFVLDEEKISEQSREE